MSSPAALRSRARQVYKELLFLGREYPSPPGPVWFHDRLRKAFRANADLQDADAIKTKLNHAEFVKKEVEAMYALRKYRRVQRAYDQL
ncbi:hypothetical protein BC828DRAFT_379365 [Blastocladiella britannica]|nr:hypothetical protein BC828DRAFT_379365 [Blastocladiella britannica]